MNMKKIIILVLVMTAVMGMLTVASADDDFEPVKNMSMTQAHYAIVSTETEAEYDYTAIDKADFDEIMSSINLNYDKNDDVLLCFSIMTVDGMYTIVWSPASEKGYLYVSEMSTTELAWHGALSAAYGTYCDLPTYYVCYAQGFDEPLTGSDEDIADYATSMLIYGSLIVAMQQA